MATAFDLLSYLFDDRDKYDPDKPIYVDAESPMKSLSLRQVELYVKKLIFGLKTIGLQPGDCVDVHLFNDIYYSCYVLAIIGAGGIWTGSNPAHTSYELVHQFRVTSVKFVITSPKLVRNVSDAVQELAIPPQCVLQHDASAFEACELQQNTSNCLIATPDSKENTSVNRILCLGESDWRRLPTAQDATTAIAAYMMTSGTTGMPKAAAISHRAMLAEARAIRDNNSIAYDISRLIFTPAFHSYSAPFVHLEPISVGHTVYLLPKFNFKKVVNAVDKFQITEIALVPPVVQQLVISCRNPVQLHSLKRVYCAGDSLAPELQLRIQQLLAPETMFDQFLGTTETGRLTKNVWPRSSSPGSVGQAYREVSMRLLDRSGRTITDDETPGELSVQSPAMMNAYRDDTEATRLAITDDGWLKTGDMACWKGGALYVTGRSKDLIKVRAWQVSPTELETVLLTHPGIKDAAVIGVPAHDSIGQVPRAYIVRRRRGRRPSAKEVYAFGRKKLASYKALAGGVEFVTTIPKTPSGKKLKRFLYTQRGSDDRMNGGVKKTCKLSHSRHSIASTS